MSLANPIAFRYNNTLGAFDGTAHVGLQFSTLYRAVTVDGIYMAVVIKQHAKVVNIASHVVVCPRAAYVVGSIALQTLAVDVRENIEHTIVVAYAGCPDALTVDFLMVLQ